jgi:hypothetical protein
MNLQEMNDSELIEFTIIRHSLIRDFGLFHSKTIDETFNILRQVLKHINYKTLAKEFRIAYEGAIKHDSRHTHYYNYYVTGYFISHYTIISQIKNDKRIREESDHLTTNDDMDIDYAWVMECSFEEITLFERQMLYEHYILGYTLDSLAVKFNVTIRTMFNVINKIRSKLVLRQPDCLEV